MNNAQRQAHFTSSQAHKLIKVTAKGEFQKPGLTYIKEKQLELKFQSCLDVGAYSQSMAWGNLMEVVLYETIGLEYRIYSKETKLHSKYGQFWSGSVDMLVPGVKVSEIKCYQRRKFGLYVECIDKKDVALLKSEFPQEYWQVVSNALIHNLPKGEVVAYMPYKSELIKIREIIEETNFLERNDFDPWQFRFIIEKDINDLPWIPDDGEFKNINIFEFDIPIEDKILLTKRMIQAGAILYPKK